MVAILLSAGLSSRMPQHKALLPWGDTSLIRFQIETLKKAGIAYVVVVLGFNEWDIRREISNLEKVQIVINPDYEEGKTTSIKIGVESAQNLNPNHILLLNVDQPRSHQVIKNIIKFHSDSVKGITVPRFKSKGGHPVIFNESYISSILQIREETLGLKEIMADNKHDVGEFDMDSEEILIDMNTEKDYNTAKLFFEL